nr:MAG TPA: restriction enzyme [Ackermannviridae sp.]
MNYVKCDDKVCIICPDHGEFWQTPHKHLQGGGCSKCSGHYIPTTEEWIVSARKVHGDKYDYSNAHYVDALTKITIRCPKHGNFEQAPHDHAKGCGCPKCNLSHLERSVMNYLDEVGITYDYQKRFTWLGKQSLDFYLPDYKVGIECQGEQHFFPVDFRSKGVEWACKMFNKTNSRDKKKKALCEENGVKLLYFGNVPNYDTFLGEVVHDDVQYLIDYLEEYKK